MGSHVTIVKRVYDEVNEKYPDFKLFPRSEMALKRKMAPKKR